MQTHTSLCKINIFFFLSKLLSWQLCHVYIDQCLKAAALNAPVSVAMVLFTGHLCMHTHNMQPCAKITAMLEAKGDKLKLALFTKFTLQNNTHTLTRTQTAGQFTAQNNLWTVLQIKILHIKRCWHLFHAEDHKKHSIVQGNNSNSGENAQFKVCNLSSSGTS